jgi:hypothetical protein
MLAETLHDANLAAFQACQASLESVCVRGDSLEDVRKSLPVGGRLLDSSAAPNSGTGRRLGTVQ